MDFVEKHMLAPREHHTIKTLGVVSSIGLVALGVLLHGATNGNEAEMFGAIVGGSVGMGTAGMLMTRRSRD